ncbi:MAG TPA: hypothetical protein VLG11_00265 [Candidatus Saccharimonadales bacterium]|nr:hypothetical protein [Candidatus Saccharimonadales bacterium]
MPERAAERVFEDGLVIPGNQLYYSAGPLSLDRDAGWLAPATANRTDENFAADQAFIDRLTEINEAGTALGLKRLNKRSPLAVVQLARQACQGFVDELGWSEVPQLYTRLQDDAPPALRAFDVLMPPTDYVFRNMRTLYAYLGNSVMEVVTDQPRLLRRNPIHLAILAEELETEFHIDVGRQLRARPELFAQGKENDTVLLRHTILKAIGVKAADLPPARSRRKVPKPPEAGAAKTTNAQTRSSQPKPPAPPRTRKAQSAEKPAHQRQPKPEATLAVVVPKAYDRFEALDARLAAAPTERQAAIRELAPNLACGGAGIHALLEVCPRILQCSDETLAVVIAQAEACEDEDGLSLRKVASILNQAL